MTGMIQPEEIFKNAQRDLENAKIDEEIAKIDLADIPDWKKNMLKKVLTFKKKQLATQKVEENIAELNK